MNSDSIQVQRPKRKLSYYLTIIISILFATSIITSNISFLNEVMFGLIIITLGRFIYNKLGRKTEQNTFEIETHYDKFNSVIMALIGIAMITFSVMNPDFMVKLNLEWINYLIIGLFLMLNVFKSNKSLRLLAKNSEVIEIEDYELKLNSEIKNIHLFSNKMILSKSESENYEFNELKIDEEVKSKLSAWIQSNIPNAPVEVEWKN